MDPLEELQQHLDDLRQRTIRAIQQRYCGRELAEISMAVATSIRGLREFRGNEARLSVLVAAFTARLENWGRLVEAAEATKEPNRITLASARARAFMTLDEAEERERKFTANEAEKESPNAE